MFYDFALTVPADTQETSPAELRMKLTAGILHNVRILFPPGPHGLVKIRILEDGHQFLPTNPDGYFASDDEAIAIDEYYPLTAEPYTMRAIGYSPGTVYPHTIAIRIGILPSTSLQETTSLNDMLKKMLRFFGVG